MSVPIAMAAAAAQHVAQGLAEKGAARVGIPAKWRTVVAVAASVAAVADLAWVGFALVRKFRDRETDSGDSVSDDSDESRKTGVAYVNGLPAGSLSIRYVDGVALEAGMAAQWETMSAAAAADGVTLQLEDGFRFMEDQQKLYAEHVAGERPQPVARPGFSKHQNGKALDVAVHRSQTSAEYVWLKANAARFGFWNAGAGFNPPEFWHWETLGSRGFANV